MIAWIKGYARGMTLLVLLAAVASVATGFSGSPQGTGQSFTPPTDVQATSSAETITVTWTLGSGASSQVIVAVNVLDDTDYCLGFDATGGASSHECPGLTIGATYVVLVIALDGAGGYRLGRDAQGNLVTHTLLSPPVSQEVGAGASATVTHDSGAQLEVPEGATTEPTTASITEVPPPASDLAVGRVFDFSVGDVQLGAPVAIHIPFELPSNGDPSLVQAVHWNAEAGQWELLEGVVDALANTIAVTTSDLSWFSAWVIEPITELVSAVLSDAEGLESVVCNVDTATPRVGADVQFSATITSGTLSGKIYLQMGGRDLTRDVSDLNLNQTTPVEIDANETITITDRSQVGLPGDYQFICQIYEERTLRGDRLLAGQPVPFSVEARTSSGTSRGYLKTCAPTPVEPLAGEPVTLEAVGFEGSSDLDRGINTYAVEVRVYHEGDLVATGYETDDLAGIRSDGINLNEVTSSLVWPGEYAMECQLIGGLVRGAGQRLVSPFITAGEAVKLSLKAYFSPASAIQFKTLLDARLREFKAATARWRPAPPTIEISPSQISSQGGERDVTVRVYTQESAVSHQMSAPNITAQLPVGLAGSGDVLTPAVNRCGITHHEGFAEFCWEAVFEDVPENPMRAEANDQGEITNPNNAEIRIQVSGNRDISGTAPSGSFVVLGRSPYSTDREALLAFYNATRGEIWIDHENWGTETHIRDWSGVNDSSLITDTEKTSGRVISLELRLNRLSGEIPDALSYLASLKVLEITGHRDTNGNLRGSIPDSLGNLANLEYLDLHGNNLSGQIPSALGNLTELESLDLRKNNLSGEITIALGNLHSLVELDLSENNLTGEIPSGLGELPVLEAFYISGNRLTGCIPAGLRGLEDDDFDDTDLPFCDVALSSLTISPGELEPEFETHQMDYSATVDQARVTIFSVNDHGATFEYYAGEGRTPATDADPSAVGFQVDLDCGEITVRIEVISADGEEDDTYTIEFTRGGVGLPAAPTIHSVSRGTGSLTVSWNAPDTTCGGTIDRYNLRYSLDQDDAAWTEVQGPSSGLSHTVSGLSADTTYRVQAQAVNEHGAGPWSGTFVASTASESDDQTVTQGNPDLVVDSPALGIPAPGSLEPGGSFTLSTTVRNQGNSASAAATLRYYRSTDSTISAADTEEGTANVSALGASGTENETIDLTAPATAGTYYYGACVDTVANESNTQNNCSGAVAATVTEPTETEVDLSVSSPSVSRGEVGPGGRFSLYVTVGITGVDEPYYIVPLSYHRSGDSSISLSDTWIGSESLALEPPSYDERTGIILYAADDVGVSYYGACVYYSDPDETNTQNNCSAGVAVTVTESIQTNQDLAISGSPTVTDSNPAPGGSFTLSVAVRNAGNAATPGTTYRYYRSSDSTITSGDTEVGTNTLNRLYPGQSDSGNIALTAPSDAGTYYYGACVDPVARESDTTNNCSSGAQVTVP